MMNEAKQKLKRKLTLIYWINIAVFIALILVLLTHKGVLGKSITEQDFIWERFGIILAIITIPLSLKLFHSHLDKNKDQGIGVFLNKLNKLFLLRTIALDSVIVLNLVGFYFIGAINFLYIAVLTILAFLLCYPTQSLFELVETEEKTDENKQ